MEPAAEACRRPRGVRLVPFGRGLHSADPGGAGAALIQLGGPLRSWVPSGHHSSPRPLLQPVGPRLCSRRPFPGLSGGPGHGAHAGAGVGRDLLERGHRIPRHRRDSRHHRRDIHNLMVGHFNQALRSLLLLLRSAGTRYAVLTGLTIAAYSIVDKEGVGQVQPLLYVYFLGTGTALMLASYILARKGAAAVRAKWQANALPITVAGLLTFTAAGLALTAFSLSRVSYVSPARGGRHRHRGGDGRVPAEGALWRR